MYIDYLIEKGLRMAVMLCGTPTYTPLCRWEAGGRWVYNKIYVVSYQGKVKYVCLKNEGRDSQVIDRRK
jgi:hypothetical protein